VSASHPRQHPDPIWIANWPITRFAEISRAGSIRDRRMIYIAAHRAGALCSRVLPAHRYRFLFFGGFRVVSRAGLGKTIRKHRKYHHYRDAGKTIRQYDGWSYARLNASAYACCSLPSRPPLSLADRRRYRYPVSVDRSRVIGTSRSRFFL